MGRRSWIGRVAGHVQGGASDRFCERRKRFGARALALGYFVRKQNHASAGRKHRNAAGNSRLQVVEHAKFAKQFALHGRFAARKHDTIELLVQVARLAELDALCAKLFKLMFMFNEAPWTARTPIRGLAIFETPSASRPWNRMAENA